MNRASRRPVSSWTDRERSKDHAQSLPLCEQSLFPYAFIFVCHNSSHPITRELAFDLAVCVGRGLLECTLEGAGRSGLYD